MGECIGKLVLTRDMCDIKRASFNLFTNEVIVQCNMLHARVKHWISTKISSPDVVRVDNWSLCNGDTKFL